MGWKSTIDVSKEEALSLIYSHMEDLENLDNETICDVLEAVMGGENHGHNYRIVDSAE